MIKPTRKEIEAMSVKEFRDLIGYLSQKEYKDPTPPLGDSHLLGMLGVHINDLMYFIGQGYLDKYFNKTNV